MVRRLVLTALGWALVLLVLGAMSLTALFRQTCSAISKIV